MSIDCKSASQRLDQLTDLELHELAVMIKAKLQQRATAAIPKAKPIYDHEC